MLESKFFYKPREVQERWFRMKFHRVFWPGAKKLMYWRQYRKLQREFRSKIKVIDGAIDASVTNSRKIDGDQLPATKLLFNIGLYFLLAERDIQAIKADAIAHPNDAKRSIALRVLLLTIYEWDMGKVTGKNMRTVYELAGLSDGAKDALTSSLRALKKARRNIERDIPEIRHNTIAHRESDAIRQYEIIRQLDIFQHRKTIEDFYSASNQLLSALTAAMSEASSMSSIVNQMLHARART